MAGLNAPYGALCFLTPREPVLRTDLCPRVLMHLIALHAF